ncbi:MAG: TauD/TfdA family dioxygenase [Gemmatimonas sp.]
MSVNQWEPAKRGRRPAVLGEPVVDPAAWRPGDFADRETFAYRLSDSEIAEIFDAVARVERSGVALKDVGCDEFPLPRFGKTLAAFDDELYEGRGFVFVRGLPVEGRTMAQNAIAFWGLGNHMGVPVPQNAKGHLLEHVKNAGGDINAPTGRGYNSPNALGFHTDTCELFSLMCLRTSKSGGEHRLCSSVTVYNEMLERRPDLAHELTFRFYRTRRGEVAPGEDPWMRQPVFSVQDGYFSARGASSTIARAQKLPGVPKLTEAQVEAIAMYQALCGELAMAVDFEPGDITYVLNHVALHARSAYEDWPEPERRRHLMRLWLNSASPKRPLHPDIAREMKGIHVTDGVLKTPLDATPVTA